jgi:hypothetical protein
VSNFDNDFGLEVNDATTEQFAIAAHRRDQALRELAQRGDSNPLDTLSADDLAELWKRSLTAEAEKTAADRQREAAQVFTAERPEFVQNPRNAQRVADYLEARGLSGQNVEDYHEAFNTLAPRGLIAIDPKKAPKPQPRRRYSEADLEAMPMEQLIQLANQESL